MAQEDLKSKIRDLEQTLAGVVLASDGEVRVQRRHRVESGLCDVSVELDETDDNLIVRAKKRHD